MHEGNEGEFFEVESLIFLGDDGLFFFKLSLFDILPLFLVGLWAFLLLAVFEDEGLLEMLVLVDVAIIEYPWV